MGKGRTKRVRAAKPTAPEPRTTTSPFYPAIPVQAPPPATPPVEAKVEKDYSFFTNQLMKPSKKAKAASWIVQVLVVAIPASITGWFSHASSKDAAETSYKNMVTAVGELQVATKELAKQQAYLQGELDMVRGENAKWHGAKVTPRPSPPAELKSNVMLSTLPVDLGSALKEKDLPMAQQIVTLVPQNELFSPAEKGILEDAKKKREGEAKAAPASRH